MALYKENGSFYTHLRHYLSKASNLYWTDSGGVQTVDYRGRSGARTSEPTDAARSLGPPLSSCIIAS